MKNRCKFDRNKATPSPVSIGLCHAREPFKRIRPKSVALAKTQEPSRQSATHISYGNLTKRGFTQPIVGSFYHRTLEVLNG